MALKTLIHILLLLIKKCSLIKVELKLIKENQRMKRLLAFVQTSHKSRKFQFTSSPGLFFPMSFIVSLISVFPWRNVQVWKWDSPLRRSRNSGALPGSLPVGLRLCLLPILLQYARLLHVRHHPKILLGQCGPQDTVAWRVHAYTSSSTRC